MPTSVIEAHHLHYKYGRNEAVHDLSLSVEPGKCYALFGRNGAGKTTTIKCLLNLIKPPPGTLRVFGLEPTRREVEIKSRLSYVPDNFTFYPWMSVRETLNYFASYRDRWNHKLADGLLDQFDLDARQRVSTLSKGQRTQVGLIAAIAPEPELLVLDEPTSGLDPLIRREFIRTVIGAYQEGDPGRTIFVSTHLISEFEGLIDEFTIMDQGRDILTMNADQAREKFIRIRARFSDVPPMLDYPDVLDVQREQRNLEIVLASADNDRILHRLRSHSPESMVTESLTLEEIFLASVKSAKRKAA